MEVVTVDPSTRHPEAAGVDGDNIVLFKKSCRSNFTKELPLTPPVKDPENPASVLQESCGGPAFQTSQKRIIGGTMHQNNSTFSGNEGVTVPHRLQADIDHAPRWQDVLQAPAFQELMKKKKAFILPSVVFFSVFYLAWPILGGFTTLLDAPTIGEMPLAYVYGFSQFPLMLILLSLYRRQASKWDDLAQQALAEATERRVG